MNIRDPKRTRSGIIIHMQHYELDRVDFCNLLMPLFELDESLIITFHFNTIMLDYSAEHEDFMVDYIKIHLEGKEMYR